MSSVAQTPLKPVVPINRTLQWVVCAALGFILAGIVAGFVRQQWKGMEQRSFTPLAHFNTVPPFTLTERSGQPFDSTAALKGKIWLANFFFTACPGPCLNMNGRMQELQQSLLRDHADVRLVSFSIAPEADTPEVLRKYANKVPRLAGQMVLSDGQPRHDLQPGAQRRSCSRPSIIRRQSHMPPDEARLHPQRKDRAGGSAGRGAQVFRQHEPGECSSRCSPAVGDLLREQPDAAATDAKGDA